MSDIILGDGVFSIGDTATALTDVALTMGGGRFVVEKDNRIIAADGDYGLVKGRVRATRVQPLLTLNGLESIESNMKNFYPGISSSSGTDAVKFTQLIDYSATHYKTVAFTGRTIDNRKVYIEITDAINLGNIDWPLVDKEEAIPEITFTAAYKSTTRTTVPFSITFGTPT